MTAPSNPTAETTPLWAVVVSDACSRIVKRDRPWHLYPNGTKAPAPNGGHYIRETGGWRWNNGDVFPTPSADVDRVILPENIEGLASPAESDIPKL